MGGWGLELVNFFTMDPNLKYKNTKHLFWLGGGGVRVSDFFHKESKS